MQMVQFSLISSGGDLAKKIKQAGNKYFSEEQILEWFCQLLVAIKDIHDKKIIHRDIKSQNVFLTKEGIIKLGDLNVSKVAKKGMLQTQTGTPYYCSPEVWKDKPYDSKCDIWSVGCVLYEMCTNEPPFKASDMQGLYKKIVSGTYPPLPPHYSNELS